ncbi:MAG: hypothetical protein HY396_01090 [Candidatus Doudnabacteria bacterium]|nr:hypothetical protein [Candidatus Doudnabacteria bacterium]
MGKYEKINKISSRAVKKATGRTWEQWIRFLNVQGAAKMLHKDIARLLYDQGHIKNGWPASRSSKSEGWWCQTVTVGYEYAKGRRAVGQTKKAGFKIGVQKVFPVSQKRAWQMITSPAGRKLWLENIGKMDFQKGRKYKTKEGTTGEIRTFKLGEKLRLAW